MIKDIKYSGITTIPSDLDGQDGDLAVAVGVVNKSGSLYAIPDPTVLFTLDDGYQLLHIHKGDSYVHYIVLSPDGVLKALDSQFQYLDFSLDTSGFSGILSIRSIGNTLILLCGDGIHYILYRDNTYLYLGQQPPKVDITFALRGRLARSAEWEVSAPEDVDTSDLTKTLSDNNQRVLTEDILAKVNKFIQEKGNDKSRFIFPFFVRYAYRMYDGSYTMHSAPVLMLPSSHIAPAVPVYGQDERKFFLRVCAIISELQVKSLVYDISELNKWKDIVAGVDVFISSPLYSYDQNGTIRSLESFSGNGRYAKANYGVFALQAYTGGLYGKHTFYEAYQSAKNYDSYSLDDTPDPDEDLPVDSSEATPTLQFSLPVKNKEDFQNSIKECSLFYKLCSLDFADHNQSGTYFLGDFQVNSDTLNTLEVQPTLPDDFLSHDILKANYAYTYNARMNLANIGRILFDGFPAHTLCPYTQPTDGNTYCYDLYTYIRESDKNILVKKSSTQDFGHFGEYLFYPNPKAYKMVVVRHKNSETPDPEPGEITTFNVSAQLTVRTYEEGEAQKQYWSIGLLTTPEGILSNTGLSLDGYIEFDTPTGGGPFEGTIPQGAQEAYLNTGIPYVEGVNTVSSATLNITADNPYYQVADVAFHYPTATANAIEPFQEKASAPQTDYATLTLIPHPGLNGAYYFGGFNEISWTSGDPGLQPSEDKTASEPNKLYTSEPENPFIYPATGVNTVGTGEILGMASTAKALSEGQFGQFPLYVFTSDGIWAMELTSSGSFIARQPVFRDVCNNPASITQTDGGIVFSTSQGILLISGSEHICLSDILSGDLHKKNIAGYHDFFAACGISDLDFEYLPFKDYLAHCRIAYDYANSRIILFNPSIEQKYAYVFSIKYRTWTTIPHNYQHVVNDYPDSCITTSDNKVIVLTDDTTSFQNKRCVIVSRPLKLDAPDVLKTIHTVIHRGLFAKNQVKGIIYASRDCIHFFPVASSTGNEFRRLQGTPYKYFIFAIFASLNHGDCLSRTSVSFTPKYTDKVR